MLAPTPPFLSAILHSSVLFLYPHTRLVEQKAQGNTRSTELHGVAGVDCSRLHSSPTSVGHTNVERGR